ncbi:hypothetical protein GGR01_003769 [Acetobacter oeni]|nr:hypothetical protein [Acetobacter oeni]
MAVRTPHEAAVGIGQADLPLGWWFILGRFRYPAAMPCFRVIFGFLLLVCRPHRLSLLSLASASSWAQASFSFAFSVSPPERGNRVVIRMQVRRHEVHPDVAICRPFDPA